MTNPVPLPIESARLIQLLTGFVKGYKNPFCETG